MSKIRQLKAEAKVALPNTGETYVADDGTVSMVLADEHHEDYEPTEDEIKEYGEWLGMSFPADDELIWIAREGLKAPLPKEWKPCKTDTGDVYYFNFKTGDSIWDHPLDEYFKNKLKTEREKLEKKKSGIEVDGALAKLKQRTVFADSAGDPPSASVTAYTAKTSPIPAAVVSAASSLNNSISSGTAVPTVTSTAVPKTATTSTFSKSNLANTTKTMAASSSPLIPVTSVSVDEVPLEDTTFKVTTGKKKTETPKASAAPSIEATPVKTSTLSQLSSPITNKGAVVSGMSSITNPLYSANASLTKPSLLASPITTSSPITLGAEPAPITSPRLFVSEAEKNLEAKVKSDMESEHQAKVKALETELRAELARLKRRHETAAEALRESHNAAVKKAVAKATGEAEDDLVSKKRALDQTFKRETEKLQDEIDDAKGDLRRTQSKAGSGNSGGANEAAIAQLQQQAREQLNAKIEAIKAEVDDIRSRHSKAKKEQIESATKQYEEDLASVATSAKAAAKSQFEQKISALKAQHEATIAKLKVAVEEEIQEEKERAERAGKGQEQALIEELEDKKLKETMNIKAANKSEISELQEAHAAQVAELKAQMRDELQRAATAGAGSHADSNAVADIESDRKARMADLRASHIKKLAAEKSKCLQEREQRLRSAATVASKADDTDIESRIAAVRATELANKRNTVAQLQEAHEAALQHARQRLRQVQSSNDAEARAATTTVAHGKLKSFIERTLAERDVEAKEWANRKEEVLRQIKAQEAAAAAAATANATASLSTAKHAAMLQAQAEVETYFADQSRQIRLKSADKKSSLSIVAQDTADVELQRKLAAVDQECRAEAERQKKEILERVKAEGITNAAELGGGVTDADDEDESDDEAAARGSLLVAPLPDVDTEVQRRVAVLNAEFESKEAALRANFRRNNAVTAVATATPHLQANGYAPHPLSRSTTPSNVGGAASQFQPPTVVGTGGNRAATSSPIYTDPIAARIAQEQQDLLLRQQSVSEARRQWESEMQMGVIPPTAQSMPAMGGNNAMGSGSGGGGGHVDPNLVAVLLTLNSKLDTMNRRIDDIQHGGGSSPARHQRQLKEESKHKVSKGNANRTSSASRNPHTTSGKHHSHNLPERTQHHHTSHKGATKGSNVIKDTLQMYLSGNLM